MLHQESFQADLGPNNNKSAFFSGKTIMHQLSREQCIQDDFVEALARGNFNEARRLEDQGASLYKCGKHGKTALQAAIDCMNYAAVKHIDSQLGVEAKKQWEMIDFTRAISDAENNIDTIRGAMCQPLVTLQDYETWSAANANKPWNEKYDNECLEKERARKEGVKEWCVARWTRRKVAARDRNTNWFEAHFEDITSQKATGSPENAEKFRISPGYGEKTGAAPRNVKNEYQQSGFFKPAMPPTFEKKVAETNVEEHHFALKVPSNRIHHEVMQSVFIQADEFLKYLECKESEYLAMSISNSLSSSL